MARARTARDLTPGCYAILDTHLTNIAVTDII
jgi:hypothetical protein